MIGIAERKNENQREIEAKVLLRKVNLGQEINKLSPTSQRINPLQEINQKERPTRKTKKDKVEEIHAAVPKAVIDEVQEEKTKTAKRTVNRPVKACGSFVL